MVTEAEINERLNDPKRTGPRVTEEQIDGVIASHTFLFSGVLTICVLHLVNGFNVTGESACVDPANYDQALGQDIAYKNARNKIWLLEGYALAERLYHGYDSLEAAHELASGGDDGTGN